jgi:hypothetical protein
MSQRIRIVCPHCGRNANVYRSTKISALCRQWWAACANQDCGHVFSGYLSVEYTLITSETPRADISLPISPRTAK